MILKFEIGDCHDVEKAPIARWLNPALAKASRLLWSKPLGTFFLRFIFTLSDDTMNEAQSFDRAKATDR